MSIRLEREDRVRRQRDLESMHRERRRVELQELQHLRHRLQVCTDVISNTPSNLPPLCWPACCRWIWSTKGRCEVTPEPWWSEGAVKGAVLLRLQGLSPLSWKIRFPTFWKVGPQFHFLWVGHLTVKVLSFDSVRPSPGYQGFSGLYRVALKGLYEVERISVHFYEIGRLANSGRPLSNDESMHRAPL